MSDDEFEEEEEGDEEIEELVESECADEDKEGALKAAEKFRRAASL